MLTECSLPDVEYFIAVLTLVILGWLRISAELAVYKSSHVLRFSWVYLSCHYYAIWLCKLRLIKVKCLHIALLLVTLQEMCDIVSQFSYLYCMADRWFDWIRNHLYVNQLMHSCIKNGYGHLPGKVNSGIQPLNKILWNA